MRAAKASLPLGQRRSPFLGSLQARHHFFDVSRGIRQCSAKTTIAWLRPSPTLAVVILTPDCHRACITVSVVLDRAVKSNVNVKTTTTNSRIDFDLKPAAAKKVKRYVRVDAKTGTHVGSGWVEVDNAGNTAPGVLNSQTASADLARQMSRNATNPKEHP